MRDYRKGTAIYVWLTHAHVDIELSRALYAGYAIQTTPAGFPDDLHYESHSAHIALARHD